jgi:hypothetical protein
MSENSSNTFDKAKYDKLDQTKRELGDKICDLIAEYKMSVFDAKDVLDFASRAIELRSLVVS